MAGALFSFYSCTKPTNSFGNVELFCVGRWAFISDRSDLGKGEKERYAFECRVPKNNKER